MIIENIQSTHLNSIIQWLSAHVQDCVTITTVNLRIFSLHHNETLQPSVTLIVLCHYILFIPFSS